MEKRFDSILISFIYYENGKTIKDLLDIIEHSRYLETAQKKMINYNKNYYIINII